MNSNYKYIRQTGLYISIAVLLSACGGGSGGSSTPDAAHTSNVAGADQTVTQALSNFPSELMLRFALSNADVIATDIYRRIDFLPTGRQTVSYGIEGESNDALLEVETRFAADGTVTENIIDEQVALLPANINTAVQNQYPNLEVVELSRITTNGGVRYAVSLENDSGEIVAHFDENAQLLFTVEQTEREEIPAGVLAMIDSRGVSLPDSEFEIVTFSSGRLNYEAGFENQNGQSITILTNESGDILRIEHVDSLENLSTSDTVETALNEYPAGVEAQFATMFSEVTAAEIFKTVTINDARQNAINYGIEGESDDQLLVIEALYSEDSVLLEQALEEIVDALPIDVKAEFNNRFSGAEIDEIVRITQDDGISYTIAFTQNENELEADFDADGNFEELVEENLDVSEIPATVLTTIGAEFVLLPINEIERVSDEDGSLSYIVDYENNDGESISYELTAEGMIKQIVYAAEL